MSNIASTSQLSPAVQDHLDLQCKVCMKSWPVVRFIPVAGKAKGREHDGVCSRCSDPAGEQRRWTQSYYKMEWRMQYARRKQSEQAIRYTSKNVQPAASLGQTRPPEPPRSKSIPPPLAPPKTAKTSPKLPAFYLQNPLSSIASTFEEIPQPASGSQVQHPPARPGFGSVDSTWGKLAPLPVRLLIEPNRAMIWFQTLYKPDPSNSVSQAFLYQTYITSLVTEFPASINCLALSPHEVRLTESNLGRPIFKIPELLKGSDFMRLIATIYPGVSLAKEGYLCVGIRKRDAEEVDQGWRNVLRWMQTERVLFEQFYSRTPPIASPLSSPSSQGSLLGRKRRKPNAKTSRPRKMHGLPPLDTKKAVVDLSTSATLVPLSATGYPPPSTPTKDSPLDVPDVSVVQTAEVESDSDNPFSFQPPGLSEPE